MLCVCINHWLILKYYMHSLMQRFYKCYFIWTEWCLPISFFHFSQLPNSFLGQILLLLCLYLDFQFSLSLHSMFCIGQFLELPNMLFHMWLQKNIYVFCMFFRKEFREAKHKSLVISIYLVYLFQCEGYCNSSFQGLFFCSCFGN